jgi:heme exporter protein A
VSAVNDHTKSGGIAVIATHLPLPLERAQTLDLAAQRMAA